ncbi:MAG TPA: hypothetical protein VI365_33250 [Trebonia sp.]
MNADLSVAPEIAQLAAPLVAPAQGHGSPAHGPLGHGPLGHGPLGHGRPAATTGQLATGLSMLAAAPQRWWDLVRFNPDGPARIAVPAPFEAWLLVLPPGQEAKCDCELATLVAGEAASEGSRLHQGRVRVHGAPGEHLHASTGHGYCVTLHAGAPG